jgi:hypothetical protein
MIHLKMQQFNAKIIITVGLVLFSLTAISQKTGEFTFGKKDSSDLFRGFGIGFEYLSGHKEMSKIFKFKRDPIDEYKIGKGFYITYFNLSQDKKFHYYIDGGIVFWNNQKIGVNIKKEQRSEILQLTGSYRIGWFRLLGRMGGLLNHNTIKTVFNTEELNNKSNDIGLITGLGLSIPIPFKSTKGLTFTLLISRVNKHYAWSGTIFIPLIFHN